MLFSLSKSAPIYRVYVKMEIMSLFSFGKKKSGSAGTDTATLAQRALDFITEGVIVIDERGMIKFANPAAAVLTGYDAADTIVGLDYQLILRLQTEEGTPVEPTQSTLYTAIMTNQNFTTREYWLVSAQTEHRVAVALSCIPTGNERADRIVTFRDITKELAEENEQAEFISTASHEMRTPVASIEGYLGLALNPQTATIDARAKQYLEAAHSASQHLGHLFKDLLDVTKLDDNRLRAHLVPVDAVEAVQRIASEREKDMAAKKLKFSFGTPSAPVSLDKKRLEPKVYMATDVDFLHEIIDNLIENAIKYTPEGGEVWVNARGDGDKVLINVTDTGIGISNEDAGHIFQKFYRVDNSQTRQIGGTGLGLYLVKQRVEALGGRVWVESGFGDGSTFFVSLPRISDAEYEKMRIAYENEQMIRNFAAAEKAQAVQAAVQAAPEVQAAVADARDVAGGTVGVQGSVSLSESSPAGRDSDPAQPQSNLETPTTPPAMPAIDPRQPANSPVEAVAPTPVTNPTPATAAPVALKQPSIVAPKPMAQSDPGTNSNGAFLQPQAAVQPMIAQPTTPVSPPTPAEMAQNVPATQQNNSNKETS